MQILLIQKNTNLFPLTFPHNYISTLANMKYQNWEEKCVIFYKPQELGEYDENLSQPIGNSRQ